MAENGYLTSGDLAMWDTARTSRYGGCYNECGGYGHYGYKHRDGMAATGIGLAAGLGGGALLLAAAGVWGVNQASKARSRGAENQANANAKTVEMLTGFVTRQANSQDGINIDVQQTMRNQAYTSAYGAGGSANAVSNALAMAEAMALLQNGNNGTGLNSAVGGCNYLRVARVSGSRLCGCDTGCGEG